MRPIYLYIFAWLFLAIFPILTPSIAQAAKITVNIELDTSAAANACTLRDAIANINAGSNQLNGCSINGILGIDDTIDFLPDLAEKPIVLDGGQLFVNQDLIINGLGRHSAKEFTTIDANDSSRGLLVLNPANVFLNDLTLTGGSLEAGEGGGVYISSNASLTLNKAIISNSEAKFGGGIYAAADSTLTLNNSDIHGNLAESGGGIFAVDTKTELNEGSSVSGNTATLSGGGIFNTTAERIYFPNLTINNSFIGNNIALEYGGGIESRRGSIVTILNSTIHSNTATLNGGGIHQNGDAGRNDLNISNTQISNNTSTTQGGGGVDMVSSMSGMPYATITSSFMVSNESGELGGAISAAGGELEITNSTLSHNDKRGLLTASATIAMFGTTVTIKNSTIVGGAADALVTPRGIHAYKGFVFLDSVTISGHTGFSFDAHDAIFFLRNTILANSTACQMDGLSSLANWGGILAKNDANNCADFAIEGEDPMLGPLQDNGGSMVVGPEWNPSTIKTLALLPGSPAIDAGSNEYNSRLGLCLATDQRGKPRNDGRCDIGAYEAIEDSCYVIKSATDKTIVFCL